ncbi:MAG: hypothetical protein AAF197_13205, partial [Pseudomonadota bacterium]
LKNNYVFSTGTEIDDKPVSQLWIRGKNQTGFFVDIWANAPLNSGNPRRSGEIDYSIGWEKQLEGIGTITAMLTYYDIQLPTLFDFENDVWGPVLKWQTGNFYSEGMMFFVDNGRNGFRVVNSYTHHVSDGLSIKANLNFADGPYSNQEAVIGKLGIAYYNSAWPIEYFGIEVSDILWAEDPFDPRGFATTLTASKDLF